MKVGILIEDHYQVLDAWYPYLRLREEGIETVFIGPGRKREYKSEEGYPAQEGLLVEKADIDEFSGIIIPGGYAPDILSRYKGINDFIKKMYEKGKLVAGICRAGWVLVSAGILKGKEATCFYTIKEEIINAGAKFIDREVVVDGNLITSRNIYDLPAFCREVIRFLKERQ